MISKTKLAWNWLLHLVQSQVYSPCVTMLVVQFLVWPFLHEEFSICSKLFLDCRSQTTDGKRMNGKYEASSLQNTHAHVKSIQMPFPKSSWSMLSRIYLYLNILTMQYLYSIRCNSIAFHSISLYCNLLYFKPCYCIVYCILLCDIVRIMISWYHLGTTWQSSKYQISHSYQTAQWLQQISNIMYHTSYVNVSEARYRILSFQYHASCVTGTHCRFDYCN